MKKDEKGLFHTTQTSFQFLFSKTDDKPSVDKTEEGLPESIKSIAGEFPELLMGKDFPDPKNDMHGFYQ